MADFATLVLRAETTGLDKGKASLDRLTVAAMKAEDQAQDTAVAAKQMGAATATMGRASIVSSNQLRGMGQQLSQVGQQTMATGNFVQALAIQLPDIGLAFGAVGTAAGLLAGIALPMVMSAFGGMGAEAKTLEDHLDDLSGSINDLSGAYSAVASAQDGYTKALAAGNLELADSYRTLIALQTQALDNEKRHLQASLVDQRAALKAMQDQVAAAQASLDTFQAQAGRRTNITSGMGIIDTDGYAEAAAHLAEMSEQADDLSIAVDVAENKIGILAQEAAIASSEVDLAAVGANNLSIYASTAADVLARAATNAQATGSGLFFAANEAARLAGVQAQAASAAGRAASWALGDDERGGNTGLAQNAINMDRVAAATVRYGAAITGVGAAAGGAAGASGDLYDVTDALDDILQDAPDHVQDWNDSMNDLAQSGVTNVSNAFGDFISGGLQDFDGFVSSVLSSFKGMLSDLISMAIKNRIPISMGGTGAAIGSPAMAGGGGGGMGSVTGMMGGVGSSMLAGAGSVVSGLWSGGMAGGMGAISTALGGATASMAGFATAIGAVALPLLAVGAVIMAFKKKTEVLNNGLRITVDGMDALVETFRTVRESRLFGLVSSENTDQVQAGRGVADPIKDAYAAIYDSVTGMAGLLNVGAARFDDFATKIVISTKGMTDEQAAQAVQDAFAGLSDELAMMALRGRDVVRDGESATQALQRLSTSIGAVNGAFRTLGFDLFNVSIRGADAASAFADLFGGLDAFAAATEFYYQNFYSLAERTRGAARQFRDGLENLNINRIPQTMEQFRNMVDRLMEQGRDGAAAGLIQLAPLFQSLIDLRGQTEETADAVDGLTRAERRAGVLSERAGLREQLWALQGRTEKLREAELATLSPSNRALQIRIWGLEDEAAAAEAAAAVNQEHKTLQLQLWELQGRTNKIREYELSQLDEANRAIQIKIWAMEDEAAAADLAARALDDAKNAAEALADSLTTDQFRSAFEFNRAVGLARNGYGTPSAPTPFGGAANTPTAPSAMQPTKVEKDTLQLLETVKRLTAKTSDILRKWDKEGLPLERTY